MRRPAAVPTKKPTVQEGLRAALEAGVSQEELLDAIRRRASAPATPVGAPVPTSLPPTTKASR